MSTTILRSRILDMAIRGQLVPQDPNEGTADDLLKTIATQRGKPITPITDNVPFTIPENWRWVKLGDIIQHNTGKTLNERKNIGTIKRKYITTSNVYWSGVDLSSVKETLFTEQEIEKYSAIKGDLLVCEGGDVGRAAIWDKDEEICFQNHLHRLRTYVPMNIKYFFYIFYNFKLQGRIKGKGIGIDGLSSGVVDKLSLPLPPLSEQHRIVAKVEELLGEVDKIEHAQTDITQAATILRSRILDLAIRGQLVPQDPNEGTADDLLKTIATQRGKAITPITDNVPFDIPANWRWVKLGDICTKIVDGDHNPPKGVGYKTEYRMYSSQNINFDKLVDIDSCRYLSKETFDIVYSRTNVERGDILLTCVGTLGRSCVYPSDEKIAFQRSVSVIKTLCIQEYIKRVFDCPYAQNIFIKESTGTAQKGFYLNKLQNIPLPLPPLAEQRRIVAKLEQLLSAIDKLK